MLLAVSIFRTANKLLAISIFRIAHRLWAISFFKTAHKLRAICNFFTIKKIHLLHVLEILPGKALCLGKCLFQILAEMLIESATVPVLRITRHNITAK